MARLLFPDNPIVNQELQLGNATFFWDGIRWKRKAKTIEVPTSLSDLTIDNKADEQTAIAGTNDTTLMTPATTKAAINENHAAGFIEENNNLNMSMWTGTQAEYDAIVVKDANTVYLVKE